VFLIAVGWFINEITRLKPVILLTLTYYCSLSILYKTTERCRIDNRPGLLLDKLTYANLLCNLMINMIVSYHQSKVAVLWPIECAIVCVVIREAHIGGLRCQNNDDIRITRRDALMTFDQRKAIDCHRAKSTYAIQDRIKTGRKSVVNRSRDASWHL